jgi:starch phosphorylase
MRPAGFDSPACDPMQQIIDSGPDEALAARLPEPLRPLAALAYDLWWSWNPNAGSLFAALDPERWERSRRNPVKLLRDLPPSRARSLADDPAILSRLHVVVEERRRDLARPDRVPDVATHDRPVAFVCAEFGLDATLPIYSGGLGVLAGDLLKQASDAALPMVGVGLFYRRGYLHQRLDRSGMQHEYWTELDPDELPVVPELDEHRALHLDLRGRRVAVRIWRAQVGRVPLYLLDTDLPENDPTSRFITSTLYTGDRLLRLMQYAVLAIGGIRALHALGIEPSVIHLNEGHASLAVLELLREELAGGRSRSSPKASRSSGRGASG